MIVLANVENGPDSKSLDMSEEVGKIKPIKIRIPITIHILESTLLSAKGSTHPNKQMSNTGIAISKKPTDTSAKEIIPKIPNKRITINGMKYFFIFNLSFSVVILYLSQCHVNATLV